MKKRRIIIFSFLLLFTSLLLTTFEVSKDVKLVDPIIPKEDIKKEEELKFKIQDYKEIYQNEDIVAYIEIPGVLSTPVVQTENNEYYLNHDLYKNYDIKGSVFLDFRNTLDNQKLLIYGHSGVEQDLPFLPLNNYTQKEFFIEHPKIYLYTEKELKTYEIFTSYIETEDFDYVNLNNFNGLTWEEHLIKLKSKSLYETNVNIYENSKILILQTCSMNNRGNQRYQLVIGKEI